MNFYIKIDYYLRKPFKFPWQKAKEPCREIMSIGIVSSSVSAAYYGCNKDIRISRMAGNPEGVILCKGNKSLKQLYKEVNEFIHNWYLEYISNNGLLIDSMTGNEGITIYFLDTMYELPLLLQQFDDTIGIRKLNVRFCAIKPIMRKLIESMDDSEFNIGGPYRQLIVKDSDTPYSYEDKFEMFATHMNFPELNSNPTSLDKAMWAMHLNNLIDNVRHRHLQIVMSKNSEDA